MSHINKDSLTWQLGYFFVYCNMELVRYEINVGIIPGILFGIREYHFIEDDVKEKDIVLYFGMAQITLTLIYNK